MATILILQNALLKTTLRALEAVGSWDAILELSTTPDPTAAYSLIKSNAEFHLSIWKYSSPIITNSQRHLTLHFLFASSSSLHRSVSVHDTQSSNAIHLQTYLISLCISSNKANRYKSRAPCNQRPTDGGTDEWTEGRRDGRRDGRREGRRDGQMDGRTDRPTEWLIKSRAGN